MVFVLLAAPGIAEVSPETEMLSYRLCGDASTCRTQRNDSDNVLSIHCIGADCLVMSLPATSQRELKGPHYLHFWCAQRQHTAHGLSDCMYPYCCQCR